MATFVLIPGAGSGPTLWDDVAAELQARGHDTVAVDLPCEDPDAGLPEYVDAAVAAIGDRDDLVVVAQSLGAFTGVLIPGRVPVRLLVMLAAMIPVPGETAGAWWDNTRHADAISDVLARHGSMGEWGAEALADVFLHDVPEEAVRRSEASLRRQSGGVFSTPCTIDAWPDVPTRALLCRQDRLFPADFERRIIRERLGLTADEMDGGHLAMLSRPADLAGRLADYWDELQGKRGSGAPG